MSPLVVQLPEFDPMGIFSNKENLCCRDGMVALSFALSEKVGSGLTFSGPFEISCLDRFNTVTPISNPEMDAGALSFFFFFLITLISCQEDWHPQMPMTPSAGTHPGSSAS